MKFKIAFLFLLTLATHGFSQSKNTIAVVYGTTSNDVNIHGVIGDFGYTGRGGSVYGLNYTREFNSIFSFETGIVFSSDDIQLHSSLPGNPGPINGNIKMVTIPAIARVSFLKVLFIDGGLLGDFETNYSSTSADEANKTATRQTGIGLEVGIGAKYNFGHLNIFVNPFFQDHAVARFSGSGNNFNLTDAGFKFGAGYSF